MSKEITTLKKGYCPRCRPDNDLDRIFYVNPDVDACYCPNCMSKLRPKIAINYYSFYISQKISKAEKLLYRDTKFYEAYCSYGDILRIDPEIYEARFGRILSLIYMSTLRNTFFDSAMEMLQNEAERYFHKLKNQFEYINFIKKVDTALDEYISCFVKKVTYKDRFHDLECGKLYFSRLHEVINFKKVLTDELRASFVKEANNKAIELVRQIETSIKQLEKKFKERIITMDGNRYSIEKVIDNNINVKQLDESVNSLGKQKRKLNDDEKQGRLLKEKVFPDYTRISLLIKISFPLMIFFLVLIAFSLTAIFISQKLKIYLVILASTSLALFILLLILYAAWRGQLSKRHH